MQVCCGAFPKQFLNTFIKRSKVKDFLMSISDHGDRYLYFCVLFFRQVITFCTASGGSDCGVMFETEFPVSGRTPTGAHPHVAHADGIWIMPFHEDSVVLIARSHRDEALEPRDREPLVLVLAEQIRRVHAHLTSHTNLFSKVRASTGTRRRRWRFVARNVFSATEKNLSSYNWTGTRQKL